MGTIEQGRLFITDSEPAARNMWPMEGFTDRADYHVVSAEQFVPERMYDFFAHVDSLQILDRDKDGRTELAQKHQGGRVATLFYQPSTRTRLSFETAAELLGIRHVSTENAREFSSAAKGETIEDTARVLAEYGYDATIMRHHETGGAARAASASEMPIINAGDGSGEHPTQSLLDAYTIHRDHKRLDHLKIVMGGDLKKGRTVRSLALLMAKFRGNSFTFVSDPEFAMEDDIKESLDEAKVPFEETDQVIEAMEHADVVYWTRTQREHYDSEVETSDDFVLNLRTIQKLPEHATIMHPLPRVGEISTEIDNDERAAYFRQAGNGLYVRAGLLDILMQRL